jgi:hypothetical protein
MHNKPAICLDQREQHQWDNREQNQSFFFLDELFISPGTHRLG